MTAGRWRAVPLAAAAGLALLAGWQALEAAAIPAKAAVAQVLLARAWDEAAAGKAQPRPWPWADTWPVGRLAVPRLAIDQIVLAGASGRTLAFGPARLDMAARPGGPAPIVLFGHRDTHFRFLQALRQGDRLAWREPGGAALDFEVAETAVLHKDALRVPVAGGRPMLLVTCFAFDALASETPLRYAVLLAERGAATVAR